MKMFELSDGVAANKAIFSHSLEIRNKNIDERNNNTSNNKTSLISQRLDNLSLKSKSGNKNANSTVIRSIKSEKEGLMREISFIPKSDMKNQKNNRESLATSSLLKVNRNDKERVQFMDSNVSSYDNMENTKLKKFSKNNNSKNKNR
jgi:hypothetical protein